MHRPAVGPERVVAAGKGRRRRAAGRSRAPSDLGARPVVPVYDAPDAAVAARFALVLNGLGAVRTKTMKAFPEAAYRQIVASLW